MRSFPLSLVMVLGQGVALGAGQKVGSIADAVAQLPSCATSCLLSAIQGSSCNLTDVACICHDATFESAAESCIVSSCPTIETLNAKNTFERTCDRPIRDHDAQYTAVTLSLLVLTTLFVAARLSYKYLSHQHLAPDDLFALLAYLASLPSFAINLAVLLPSGIGRDIWTLSPAQITSFGYWFYVLEPLYFVQLGLVKMAILAFFLRIFRHVGLDRVLWATVAFNAASTLSFTFAAIFQCAPVSYYWTRWDEQHRGTCNDINALGWASAIICIVLDLWMLGIPLVKIQRLSLGWRQKMAAALMFCVGTLVTIISILRLRSIVLFGATKNPTWDQYGLALWTTLEVPIGIICSCMPATRLILIKALPQWLGRLMKHYSARRYTSARSTTTSNPDSLGLEFKGTSSDSQGHESSVPPGCSDLSRGEKGTLGATSLIS